MRAFVGLCAAVATIAATSAVDAQRPPDQAARFPSAVEEVLVDVVVADRDGNPVGSLVRDDFAVAEDGAPQTILSFEAVEVAPGAARDQLAPLPAVSANPAAGGRTPGRTFLVLFDDLRLGPAQGEGAKRALRDFLRTRVNDADNLLLVTTSGSTWWGARVADGRDDVEALVEGLRGRFVAGVSAESVSDAEAFRIEVQRDGETFEHVLRRYERMAPSVTAPPRQVGMLDGTECQPRKLKGGDVDTTPQLVCEAAQTAHSQAVARLRATLSCLERALGALGGVRGRKAAVLVSPGFYHDTELDGFRRVVEASRRANAPVYFLNATGLPDLPAEMSAQVSQPIDPGDVSLALRETTDAAAGAEVIASDTGGFVIRNRNDLTKGLRRIADEARRYYLIGYTPTNAARDGKYRKIQVKLAPAGAAAGNRNGWEIRARRGYYAPKEGGAPRDKDAPVREALASPFDLAGLPVRLAAYALEEKVPGRTRCLIVGEVDVQSLPFREEEGRALASLDFAVTTTSREGNVTEHAQRVDMKLLPETRARLVRDWYRITHEVELPAGVHQARLVVRDVATGRIGSVGHRIDIPESGSFRISTPLFSDALEPVPKGTPPRLVPIARREFAAGTRVFLSLDVFGAERGAVSGQPRVSMGYEVVRPDGEVLTRLEPKTIEPTAEGALHRVVGFTPEDSGPGEYRLEGQVTDEQTGKVLLFSEFFTLRAPSRPPGGY